jgi:tetratricopeptide (TPR) repeat protein
LFPRFNLAVSRFISKDYPSSIVEAEKVIHQLEDQHISDPAYATIFYILAAAQFHLGNLKEAEQVASKGVAYAPKSLDCHFVLSALNDRKGDYPKALKYGERYLELYRGIQELPTKDLFDHKTVGDRWRLLLTLSFASAKLDRPGDAATYCEEAFEAASLQSFPLTERIKFCTKIGLYDIALKYCNQITAQPSRGSAEGPPGDYLTHRTHQIDKGK